MIVTLYTMVKTKRKENFIELWTRGRSSNILKKKYTHQVFKVVLNGFLVIKK